jgi:Zn-dependent protease
MEIQGFLTNLLLRAPGILIGITIHEYAHGLVALWRGDPTARQEGRLSLNPLAHLDTLGTLMLVFGPFGWAKPVPVNYFNLDKPKRDMILVSLAGPASNILCAGIIGTLIRFWNPAFIDFATGHNILLILKIAFLINIGLSFFNLLPIPPLDGSNILMGFLPHSKIPGYLNAMRYVPMIFFIAIFLEWSPLHIPTISFVLNPLFSPYLAFWNIILTGGKVF